MWLGIFVRPHGGICHEKLTSQYEIESRAINWEHRDLFTKGLKIFAVMACPYDASKTSLQISDQDFHAFDLILGMDENNVSDLKQWHRLETEHKIHLFLQEKVFQIHGTQEISRPIACSSWLSKKLVGSIRD